MAPTDRDDPGVSVLDFLVTMTTQVPADKAAADVAEMRAREGARAVELAEQGTLLRLWRPPLQPGEWRTLGLFTAPDENSLETDLASMPLRAWRTDEVTPLAAHPNDPHGDPRPHAVEYLVAMTIVVPADVTHDVAEDTFAREADRARHLSADGHLSRLWALPPVAGHPHTLGLWTAADEQQLTAVISDLPLYPWMDYQVTPLSEHPSDPARQPRARS